MSPSTNVSMEKPLIREEIWHKYTNRSKEMDLPIECMSAKSVKRSSTGVYSKIQEKDLQLSNYLTISLNKTHRDQPASQLEDFAAILPFKATRLSDFLSTLSKIKTIRLDYRKRSK